MFAAKSRAVIAVPILCCLSMGTRAAPHVSMIANVTAKARPTQANQIPSAPYSFGNPKDSKAFTVWAVSPRAGLTFTDSEPLDVRVRVGAAPDVTTVEYTVGDVAAAWNTRGTLTIEK